MYSLLVLSSFFTSLSIHPTRLHLLTQLGTTNRRGSRRRRRRGELLDDEGKIQKVRKDD